MNPSQVKFLNVSLKWNQFLGFFGLSHFKETGRKSNQINYTVSYKRIAYSIFVLIFLLVVFLLHTKYFKHHDQNENWNTGLNLFFESLRYLGSLEAILILLTTICHSKSYAKLVTDITHCELKFQNTNDETVTKRSVILLGYFFCILIGSYVSDFYLYSSAEYLFEVLVNTLVGHTILMYNILSIIHFSMAQFWVHKSFKRINDNLLSCCTFNLINMELQNTNTAMDNTSNEDLRTFTLNQRTSKLGKNGAKV